ncbi:MAG: hypothetical protein ACM3JD_01855 [Rudaea sp.]
MERNLGGARRIHIVGGPGSGKSTLARQLANCLSLPVYSLDAIAFEGPDFAPRPLAARAADVRRILHEPGWIAEGMFLGWTSELLEQADAIVWLDHVRWSTAARRILVRFVNWGVDEAKRQPGARKFNRFDDYSRHLTQLWTVLIKSRRYYTSANGRPELDLDSRASTARCLERYRGKVIHCEREIELDQLVTDLTRQAKTELESRTAPRKS